MYINLLNEDIYYFLENDSKKPLVVYIHGLGGRAHFFEQYSKFENREYRILTFDLIGRGNTKTHQNLSIDLWMKNIYAILDYLNIDKFILLSHSLGAYFATKIINSKKYHIIDNLFVAPFNPFVNKNSSFLSKIKSIYSNRNINDLFIMNEHFNSIDKNIANSLMIFNYENYLMNYELLTTLIDINFYNKKMLPAFKKMKKMRILAAKKDHIANVDSIGKLLHLNPNFKAEFIEGEHNIIITQKEIINSKLNQIAKNKKHH